MYKNKIFVSSILAFVLFTLTDIYTASASATSPITQAACEALNPGKSGCVTVGSAVSGCPNSRPQLDYCVSNTGGTPPEYKNCCGPAPATPPGPTTPAASTGGLKYTLLEKIPGFASTDGSNLPKYIIAVYNVALAVVILSAVLMVSIGGFMYLTSAGNTSSMGTAKGIIFDALIGLVIALAAWLLLNVINPDLVNVTINGLSVNPSALPTAPITAPVSPTSCTSPNTGAGCCPGDRRISCYACDGCSAIPTTLPNKGCGIGTCFLSPGLITKIQAITGITGWRITESWPPTVNHLSTCHKKGTCADLNNSGGNIDPATIKKYYDAFKAAGLDVLYESKDCASYTAVGVTNCKSYPTMTNSSSFHVQ